MSERVLWALDALVYILALGPLGYLMAISYKTHKEGHRFKYGNRAPCTSRYVGNK